MTDFDRRMRAFIDRAETVPMRLITNEGLVDGQRLLIDSLQLAYVDLDMLASSDLSFRLNLLHFLEERFRVRRYSQRIGTDMTRDFPRAHRAGIERGVQGGDLFVQTRDRRRLTIEELIAERAVGRRPPRRYMRCRERRPADARRRCPL